MRAFASLLLLAVGCFDPETIGGLLPPTAAGDDGGSVAVDSGSGSSDAGTACSDASFELERMRADLMLIVDDAASIAPWWPALNDGLRQFLQTTAQAGLGVGLQRFDEVCEAPPYSTPLLAIAPLRSNLPELLRVIPGAPLLSTSTVPALDGVHQYARSWAAANSGSRVAVVLLTDAAPGACDGLVGDYVGEALAIARAANANTPSIPTYVVGFGSMEAVRSIAQAGGTEARVIGVTPGETEVRDALESVRREVEPCAFRWPQGWTLAPSSEIVIAGKRHPVLESAAQCGERGGFYVQDRAAAYPLLACARTCDSIAPGDAAMLSGACPRL